MTVGFAGGATAAKRGLTVIGGTRGGGVFRFGGGFFEGTVEPLMWAIYAPTPFVSVAGGSDRAQFFFNTFFQASLSGWFAASLRNAHQAIQ